MGHNYVKIYTFQLEKKHYSKLGMRTYYFFFIIEICLTNTAL
jgi:hypothetical protein